MGAQSTLIQKIKNIEDDEGGDVFLFQTGTRYYQTEWIRLGTKR